jgi:hypothetical protein
MMRDAFKNRSFDIYKQYKIQDKDPINVANTIVNMYLSTLDEKARESIKTDEQERLAVIYTKLQKEFSSERKTRNDKQMQDTVEPDINIKDNTTDTKQAEAPKNDSTYFGVVGVKSNDVLNMRIKPNYKTTLVAKIPFDATCLEEIHVDINSGKTGWMKVRYKDSIGWVSVKFLELDDRCP